MPFHFQAEQFIPHPLGVVFCFFSDPDNLPQLMPAWQSTRIESAKFVPPSTAPEPFEGCHRVIAGTGTQITLSLRPFPLSPMRLNWTAKIEDFRWLHGFCDVQDRGPFKSWRHCHTLAAANDPATGRAGTKLLDAVTYELPMGPLGILANALIVRPQLKSTFRFRHRRTLALLDKKDLLLKP